MRTLKFIVERHTDSFHIESFGTEAFDDDSDVEAAYVAEGTIVVV
jgi:hypothetical protein